MSRTKATKRRNIFRQPESSRCSPSALRMTEDGGVTVPSDATLMVVFVTGYRSGTYFSRLAVNGRLVGASKAVFLGR